MSSIQNERALHDTVHRSEMVTVVMYNPNTNEGTLRLTNRLDLSMLI